MEKREWKTIKEYQDILFDFYNGIAKITINRPRYRNAFTPTTTTETHSLLPLHQKSVTHCLSAANVRTSM